jgi:hypothetical protein
MAHFPGHFVITDLSDPEGIVKLASRLAIQWKYSGPTRRIRSNVVSSTFH